MNLSRIDPFAWRARRAYRRCVGNVEPLIQQLPAETYARARQYLLDRASEEADNLITLAIRGRLGAAVADRHGWDADLLYVLATVEAARASDGRYAPDSLGAGVIRIQDAAGHFLAALAGSDQGDDFCALLADLRAVLVDGLHVPWATVDMFDRVRAAYGDIAAAESREDPK